MKTYVFEIQNCIKVSRIGNSVEEARRDLIDDLEDYAQDMIVDCVVSDGEEE